MCWEYVENILHCTLSHLLCSISVIFCDVILCVFIFSLSPSLSCAFLPIVHTQWWEWSIFSHIHTLVICCVFYYLSLCICVCLYIITCLYIYIYLYISYMHTCFCIYIYLCVSYIHTCLYIYIYRIVFFPFILHTGTDTTVMALFIALVIHRLCTHIFLLSTAFEQNSLLLIPYSSNFCSSLWWEHKMTLFCPSESLWNALFLFIFSSLRYLSCVCLSGNKGAQKASHSFFLSFRRTEGLLSELVIRESAFLSARVSMGVHPFRICYSEERWKKNNKKRKRNEEWYKNI